MKSAIIAAVITTFGATALAQSKDPMAGTWKLNVARSHYSPDAPPKGQTTVFEAIARGMTAVSTTARADGTTTRIETTFQFDGREYEVKGAANKTYRAYKRAGERRFEWTNREDGKITTTTGSVHNVQVYDREP